MATPKAVHRSYGLRIDTSEFPEVCEYLDQNFSSVTIAAMVQYFLDRPDAAAELIIPARRVTMVGAPRRGRGVSTAGSANTEASATVHSAAPIPPPPAAAPVVSGGVASVLTNLAARGSDN